jgi:hypothetical protein
MSLSGKAQDGLLQTQALIDVATDTAFNPHSEAQKDFLWKDTSSKDINHRCIPDFLQMLL